MSLYNREDWRCPACGYQDIKLTTEQLWLTETIITEGLPDWPEPIERDIEKPKYMYLVCLYCGYSSNEDDDWHMPEGEWGKEKIWEEADQRRFKNL